MRGGWGHINVDDFRANDAPIGREMKIGSSPFDNFHTYLDTGYDQPYRPLFHFTRAGTGSTIPTGYCTTMANTISSSSTTR